MSSNNNYYDVIIIGGGPAGLSAALYLSRAKYRVLVVEKNHFGGQITITSEIVNYPGVKKTSGKELTDTMREQAQGFNAEFLLAEVISLDLKNDLKVVKTSKGDLYSFGVLLATGAHPRMVGFKGEEEFKGHGVAYCATCDGEFFTNKEVFVVGGGFAAAEEGVFLTKYASHVTILVRGDDFTCAKATSDLAYNNPKITVLTNTIVEEVKGDNFINHLKMKNTKTGEIKEFDDKKGFGVFVFAGYEPETELVSDLGILDEHGYIITDRNQKTAIDGLYAAGDICVKNLRQVVTAVADGAIAATELERVASYLQKKTNIYPKRESVENTSSSKALSNDLFDEAMINQLSTVFSKMENSLTLKLYLDDRPVSNELKTYMEGLALLTDKLSVEISNEKIDNLPVVRIYKNNNYTGLAFHGVPGGHEFTSFILGLYNASGIGQPLDAETLNKINSIKDIVDIKILISLTCTMCPELVVAAQKIAANNSNVTAEVFDINHFEELRNKYNVMSVPCLILNDKDVSFGKKNINQLLDIIIK